MTAEPYASFLAVLGQIMMSLARVYGRLLVVTAHVHTMQHLTDVACCPVGMLRKASAILIGQTA